MTGCCQHILVSISPKKTARLLSFLSVTRTALTAILQRFHATSRRWSASWNHSFMVAGLCADWRIRPAHRPMRRRRIRPLDARYLQMVQARSPHACTIRKYAAANACHAPVCAMQFFHFFGFLRLDFFYHATVIFGVTQRSF